MAKTIFKVFFWGKAFFMAWLIFRSEELEALAMKVQMPKWKTNKTIGAISF